MPSNNRNRLTPGRLQVREKEQRALELRMAGLNYRQIAEQVGWNTGEAARKAIMRLLDEQVREPAQHLRTLEVERLDRMITALWPQALSGKWLAVDRILKIMERKSALLGLDAPQRRIVDVITHDAFAEALKEREREVEELRDGPQRDTVMSVDIDDLERSVRAELEAGAPVVDAEVVEEDAPVATPAE